MMLQALKRGWCNNPEQGLDMAQKSCWHSHFQGRMWMKRLGAEFVTPHFLTPFVRCNDYIGAQHF